MRSAAYLEISAAAPPQSHPQQYTWRGVRMSENSPLKVGQKVPSFQIDTYDPVSEDFSTFSLDKAKADQKWTILFFYPADFTFV